MANNTWIEHLFQGDDLLGGVVNFYILMNFPNGSTFSVQLLTMTSKCDPEPFSGEDEDHAIDLEVARWMNPDYQLDTLGVPLGEYLEEDPEGFDFEARHDFLGGETLEEYREH